MSDLSLHRPPLQPLPEPRTPIAIRPATLADVPFMDRLQKLHTKQVGWMPTAQFEGKIRLGHVLIAEEGLRTKDLGLSEEAEAASLSSAKSLVLSPKSSGVPVGYLIGNDQYFKRDDVGIIYQLNVAPDRQRGWIGAALLKAQFERSAWGCRLYCCWCAQDIAANKFWEAMGFAALAFRTGSRTRGKGGRPRVHIFWQKQIRRGEAASNWWYPSQTGGGAVREDRLVLPIPPGMHWSDEMPVVLPAPSSTLRLRPEGSNAEGPEEEEGLRTEDSGLSGGTHTTRRSLTKSLVLRPKSPGSPGGLRFARPAVEKRPKPARAREAACPVVDPEAETRSEPRRGVKNDPKQVAMARELRDRWLEEVNAGRYLPETAGKYDVRRQLDARPQPLTRGDGERLLPAA